MQGSRRPDYRSDALEVLHETVSGLYRQDAIDKAIPRHFDLGCLIPAEPPRQQDDKPSDPPLLTGDPPKPPA